MNLALFDFDGTITTRETFPDFIRFAVGPRRFAFGKAVLAPLILGYKLGFVSGSLIRAAIVRCGFSGMALASLESRGLAFAQQVLPDVVRPEALERIAWHKSQGDTVVVVSGALDSYLAHWCGSQQLELICSSLEHRDGTLSGRYLGAQCVLGEKSRRVKEKYDLSRYGIVYAYGDTSEDLHLLAIADRQYYRWQEVAACP